jgi:hypothetical protein
MARDEALFQATGWSMFGASRGRRPLTQWQRLSAHYCSMSAMWLGIFIVKDLRLSAAAAT